MAYRITLTANDVITILCVGHRYCWSNWALRLVEGNNELAEHEAWEFREAIEADMEGGHTPFPMLNPESELYSKLWAFFSSVV